MKNQRLFKDESVLLIKINTFVNLELFGTVNGLIKKLNSNKPLKDISTNLLSFILNLLRLIKLMRVHFTASLLRCNKP